MPDLAVGSIQQSLLSEAQFQAVMGSTNWVLANGQGVSGSQYNAITGFTNVPDFRGCFIRMTGGEAALLGVKQDASIGSGDISANVDVGGTSVDVGGLSVTASGSKTQFNGGPTTKANYSATMNIKYQTRKGSTSGTANTMYLVGNDMAYNGQTQLSTTNSHSHNSMNWTGTFSASGTTPSTNRNTATETRAATVIAGEETRPVNIAVNYFIKIN